MPRWLSGTGAAHARTIVFTIGAPLGHGGADAGRLRCAARSAGPVAAPNVRDRSLLHARAAGAAYVLTHYGDCARLYAEAAESAQGRAKADYAYSSGVCELRIARRSEALASVRRAMQAHPSYYDDIVKNGLVQKELSGDATWSGFVASFKPAYEAFSASLNGEPRDMYLADQQDREGGPDKIDWTVVHARDSAARPGNTARGSRAFASGG